jgi:hypothetical protein
LRCGTYWKIFSRGGFKAEKFIRHCRTLAPGDAVRLTDREQWHVRTAIRFLRYRVGGWQPLADALGVKADSLGKVLRGARDVTARLSYGVAWLTDVAIDDLARRRVLPSASRCGSVPPPGAARVVHKRGSFSVEDH